jgi:hypothetical protein
MRSFRVRSVASIVVLARETGLTASVAEEGVARCLQTYRDRIGHYAKARQLDIWYDLITVQKFVALFAPEEQEQVSSHIERKARRRTSAGAVGRLTRRVRGHLRIIEDPPLRVRLQPNEPALADEVFEAYRASLPEYRRHLLDRFSFVDAARQVVGVGSVGMRVFLVLLEGRDGWCWSDRSRGSRGVWATISTTVRVSRGPARSASDLLRTRFPAQAADTAQIVFRARTGELTEPSVKAPIEAMLARVARLAHVTGVVSPYAQGARDISPRGTIGFATVTFDQQSDLLPTAAINLSSAWLGRSARRGSRSSSAGRRPNEP